MPSMLDLCCGMGGASRAMVERGWRVVRVDIDSRVHPDLVMDVRASALSSVPSWELVWASPPCTEFSHHGIGLPSVVARRREPDLSIVTACIGLIRSLGARWWVVENVWASRPWIEPLLGPPVASVPGHLFWGRLPGLIPQTQPHKHRSGRAGMPSWRRSLYRSRIPYDISLALAVAVETQLVSRAAQLAPQGA